MPTRLLLATLGTASLGGALTACQPARPTAAAAAAPPPAAVGAAAAVPAVDSRTPAGAAAGSPQSCTPTLDAAGGSHLDLEAPPCGPRPSAPAAAEPEPQSEAMDCAHDSRVTAYAPGLMLVGAAHRLQIVGAQPAGARAAGRGPPQMGINALTVRVLGPRGRPVPAARVTLTASMPDHAHGGSRVVGDPHGALLRLRDIDLMMPGVWLFTFDIDGGGGPPDRASVHLCIPG